METRNIQIPQNLIDELGVPQLIDITDQLPKNRIKNWDQLNPQRKPEALTDIAWHHSAEFVADDISPETHALNHIKKTGDHATGEGGFPYQFYIKNGAIFQGNNILTFTYSISSNNYQTVNCCVEGCYAPDRGRPADVLSDENRRAMIALELTLRGIMPNYQRTNGHNFYKPTLCPGYSMTRFREETDTVAHRLNQQSTWMARMNKVNDLANQYEYMFNLMKVGESSGEAQWALNQLLEVRQIMIERKLLKPDQTSLL